ncbi:alpha-2A adrenergic receptor-like [Actinia tenebrosa]|uniref:Alpha-2A adrenergic receptor-like n=1 Tax=Actinia tenebrosa TaxID=6105 RepID=A0A6P8J3L2_ACTTE|nr:alpha-2A adrenergic receptor-like [Actinia tenebrosa]XP_031574207.1 alpha-2A adrenergic receptor-like [Actinia tenebrosa]
MIDYNSTINNSEIIVNGGATEKPLWYWIINTFISMVTVSGNGLVIYVLVTRRRLLTPVNWFVLSLSISDFLIGLFLPPMSAICEYGFKCNKRIFYLFYNSLMSLAVINIFTMTFDRYFGIVYPLKYHLYMTNTRIRILLACSWVTPVILSCIPVTWSNAPPDVAATSKRIHTSIMLAIFEFFPPVLMLLMYIRILLTARRHARQTANQIAQLNYNQYSHNASRNRTERSVRVIGAVVMLFVFCWLLDIYKSICWHYHVCSLSPNAVCVSIVLLYLNSAVNPLVYALLKNDFKREIRNLFCCTQSSVANTTLEMTENKNDKNTLRDSVYHPERTCT